MPPLIPAKILSCRKDSHDNQGKPDTAGVSVLLFNASVGHVIEAAFVCGVWVSHPLPLKLEASPL